MTEPRYDGSIKFLELWKPGGPWILTAVKPDRKGIDTRTFRSPEDATSWLQEMGMERNVYFHVNPTTHDLDKKATRQDIESLSWLHVDIDPRAGEDIDKERARALEILRNPPGDIPKPTVIVFSGGGYQGFWKLSEPVKIDGQEQLFEDAKLYNIYLEIAFGADNCHNVDRIMRLPGTVNRPDAKKLKKGRKETLAELVEWNTDRVYSISDFKKSPKIQTDDGFSGGKVSVSGNVKHFGDIDALPDEILERTKILIAQGEDPANPTKFASRSHALFSVACDLVRAGLDDDDIYSIITDPGFRISESVIEKGRGAERYAVHQIERAREKAIHPMLMKLNHKHAVIGDIGGKCRVISEIEDHVGEQIRTKISLQSFEDIRNRYMNIPIECGADEKGKKIIKPLGHWWLQRPERRQYETMMFAPGKEIPGVYNLWRGFAVEARPGDCSLFIEHVKQNICNNDEEHFNYLMGWMAMSVQHPERPGFSAVVMRGDQGTGKGFFAKTIGSLFGRHYMQVSDPKHLVGAFNAHLRDCVICFADEAFYAGDKKHESILKSMVTEETITIEAKGINAETTANCLHLILASNNAWVVPAGFNERRFFVLDVASTRMQDNDYFGKIQKQMDAGGREALLHTLLNYDLNGFDVRTIPMTEALRDQKLFGLTSEQEWWYTKLREGQLLPTHNGWSEEVCTYFLLDDYVHYTRRFNVTRRGNSTRMGQFLRDVCPDLVTQQRRGQPVTVRGPDGQDQILHRPYFYTFGGLQKLRDHWDKNFVRGDWGEIVQEKPAGPVSDPF